ncbi:unnamed protein product [Parascedosporium putredinis]|uniref:Uncharacterized protein n=1 Tax=Parascedosporium putredinis TaxID=1442378 RepID=A0A9P1M8U0_9PEZI|nr:unnamed protein product [Parascedosporium putredinis]CAI7994251.1 unnamed protein product [Parascedosporium putredinis]
MHAVRLLSTADSSMDTEDDEGAAPWSKPPPLPCLLGPLKKHMRTPDTLFHTLLTVIDYHVDPSGGTQSTYVLGTHTDLPAAKAFSKHALQDLGYERDDFATYEEASAASTSGWSHGDGVIVHAKAPAGQIFNVALDTAANNEDAHRLQPRPQRRGEGDAGAGFLRAEGDAMIAAKGLLNKADYDEYAERDEGSGGEKWEYGEDVVVHAVSSVGENFDISVTTTPGAHKRHGKKKG